MEKMLDKDLSIVDENEKLIANILHDIKSPLYSIKIAINSHLDTELNNDIYETTASILDYIENFLVCYSFKKGKFENKIEPCNLKELIHKKIQNYKYILKNKNIEIDIIETGQNYIINNIPIFVSSIIGNLISNIAFHASEGKRAVIEINRNKDQIFMNFVNEYNSDTNDFSLGLDFCRTLAEICKIELRFTKTKKEVKVYVKIPNLSC